MVNTRQFSGSTYMQDMTKSHTFSAKNQGSTYTPIRLIRREIRYGIKFNMAWGRGGIGMTHLSVAQLSPKRDKIVLI